MLPNDARTPWSQNCDRLSLPRLRCSPQGVCLSPCAWVFRVVALPALFLHATLPFKCREHEKGYPLECGGMPPQNAGVMIFAGGHAHREVWGERKVTTTHPSLSGCPNTLLHVCENVFLDMPVPYCRVIYLSPSARKL